MSRFLVRGRFCKYFFFACNLCCQIQPLAFSVGAILKVLINNHSCLSPQLRMHCTSLESQMDETLSNFRPDLVVHTTTSRIRQPIPSNMLKTKLLQTCDAKGTVDMQRLVPASTNEYRQVRQVPTVLQAHVRRAGFTDVAVGPRTQRILALDARRPLVRRVHDEHIF